MPTFITSFGVFLARHKILSVVVLLALAGGAWWIWSRATSTTGETRYVLGQVTRSTLIASVSGSGQVAANQQLDLKPKVSGQITYIGVTPGESVGAGTLIATIDPTDAQNAVRDAQANLDSAKLALEKLQEPATTLTTTQQANAISQSQSTLTTQYQNSYSDVTSTFLDLPNIISSLQTIELGTAVSGGGQWNIDYYENQAEHYNIAAKQYRDLAYNDYTAARAAYDQTFADFKSVVASPDHATIEKMLQETHDTTALIGTAAKSANDLIQYYSDQLTTNGATPKATAATQITSLSADQQQVQTHLTTLLADQNNLASTKNTILENQQTQQQTKAGPDQLDVQSAQLTVVQRQNALADAQSALADYSIRAPFAGTIATLAVHKFDQAGSGTAIATIVTTQQLADLSLNEVDAAKIKVSDKATLTFEAIPGLTLTGSVAEIDPVGVVTQGVVSYDVKISFDAQNSAVKSGMTVNASIQTAVAQDVLNLPQAAVKTQNGQSYVLVFNPPIASSTVASAGTTGVISPTPPKQMAVTTGLSDDTNIEIVSGLTEGQQVVTRTNTGSATAAVATAGAGAGARGGGFGGGAGIRIP